MLLFMELIGVDTNIGYNLADLCCRTNLFECVGKEDYCQSVGVTGYPSVFLNE